MATPSMPEDRPLTVADLQTWPKGTEARLYYHSTNKGDFLYRHDHMEGTDAYGSVFTEWEAAYMNAVLEKAGESRRVKPEWGQVFGTLYEFEGVMCRGSGAEPVWLVEPPPPVAATDEEFEDEDL